MTDKKKIRAEIDRLLKEWKGLSSTEAKYRGESYKEMLEFIDSLPNEPFDYTNATITQKDFAEPVSKDLEKASEDYAYTNWQSDDYHEGASEGLEFDAIGHTKKSFIAGANWQKEQTIDRACEWLLNNIRYYSTNALGAEYMCNDFREAMEEEK